MKSCLRSAAFRPLQVPALPELWTMKRPEGVPTPILSMARLPRLGVPGRSRLTLHALFRPVDREKKLPIYAQARIEEVWIVDLFRKQIEVYREPAFNGYGSKRIFGAGEKAVSPALPGASVAISELFK